MNTNPSTECLDVFPCSFFDVGKLEIMPAARKLLTNNEIINALKRHTHCDFGEVSWEHFSGNLQFIAETHGTITSVFTSLSGEQFYIMTHLDDLDPRTRILIP